MCYERLFPCVTNRLGLTLNNVELHVVASVRIGFELGPLDLRLLLQFSDPRYGLWLLKVALDQQRAGPNSRGGA